VTALSISVRFRRFSRHGASLRRTYARRNTGISRSSPAVLFQLYGDAPPQFRKDGKQIEVALTVSPIGSARITLEAEDTKTAEPRIIAMIDGLPELFEGLRRANPDAEYVFLRKVNGIKTIIKAWRNACVRAGIRVKINGVEVVSHFEKDGTYRGFLFHDLRRSAVRNFIRAGVPRSIAMKISGHKTEEVFERYNITSEDDL
jgi:hypothetical protein